MSNQQQYPQQPRPDLPYPGPYQQPPKPPKKPMSKEARIGWTILAGFAIFALGAIVGSGGGSDTASVSSTPQPTVTVTLPNTGPSPDPLVKPTNEPSKPAAAKTTAPSPKPSAKPKPTVYKKLTAREWAKIAKSPDSHVGEAYIVYGRVSQFDSATGDDQFRADVDGVRHTPSYGYVDYPTNTLMTNFSGDVSDLVEDDLFTAKVIVLGSYSYDTQIGGETTVPQLSVMSITVTGSVK